MGKIRMGMVGGGQGAFIGAVHRIAAQLDNQIELVCGAFSSDPQRSKESGESYYLDTSRCYASYEEMFSKEQQLPEDTRMQMVAIVTPNHLHFPVAKLALESGFHVMSDKPATSNLSEAIALKVIVEKSGLLYGLTHTYTGYPMVKEAKARIQSEQLGKITKVVVQYPQGWLASKSDENSKQASWRLDPAQAGISCCMADIGVHAANLAEYVTGLKIESICAQVSSVVPGRSLDDDGTVLLRFDNGATGVLIASQISVGEENNLSLNIYGEDASLEWSQLSPNTLLMKFPNQSSHLIRSGVGDLHEITLANMRTPAGHPEGYLEAFANIYTQFSYQVRAFTRISDTALTPAMKDVPGINEGIRGMTFIENVIAASRSNQKWHPMDLACDGSLKTGNKYAKN